MRVSLIQYWEECLINFCNYYIMFSHTLRQFSFGFLFNTTANHRGNMAKNTNSVASAYISWNLKNLSAVNHRI